MKNRFLTNYSEITFLTKIRESLKKCTAFYFSVSFIKNAGLQLIINDIESALDRGVEGKVITSTYQNFTDIESLKVFLKLSNKFDNFECKLDFECLYSKKDYSKLGYHSKGYLFVHSSSHEVIIGSSNITRYALLKNIEWNVSYENQDKIDLFNDAFKEFEYLWSETQQLENDIIKQYTKRLSFAIERWDMDYEFDISSVKPNYMQRKALKELNRYRAIGLQRALVISAAGSGKTFLAAFDALNFSPKKLLYIVHEGSILRKSLETFGEVFGGNKSLGIFDANSKDLECEFLFSTNISISKNIELFKKKEFDYIIIDEAHHATSLTYEKILNYFEPEFVLGLTATPERMDNKDVFSLFDQNVPFELRLRDAILNDLIVPFKYYGIRDSLVEYDLNKSQERRLVAQISDVEHCKFLYEEIEKHKPQKQKIKAIAFCRNIAHARMICQAMSEYYNTAYLTGSNNVGERIKAYNDLQDENSDLEILFSVDILNEGVDIPGVNMVLFLRPTESSTVFIQQLGRGLRKFDNKDYVTVLDFIGNNYKRSVQIAFALSSLSENFVLEKRLMLSLIDDDFSQLGLKDKGVEINIDKLSKEEIKHYIEEENFNRLAYLKKEYEHFKQYVNSGIYPRHMDYFENKDVSPDITRFMGIAIYGKKNRSYYNFLKGIQEENLPNFNEQQIHFIDYLSEMLPLVRPYEFEIAQCMLNENNSIDELKKKVKSKWEFDEKEFKHAVKFMEKKDFFNFNEQSLNIVINNDFNAYVKDLIDYGLSEYELKYKDNTDFKLWSNYRKDQVLLKLCKNPRYNHLGTYMYEDTVYIFAALKKDENIKDHLKYKDKFINKNLFQWETQANTFINKPNGKKLIDSKEAYVFVRKVESENGLTLPFTYVGTGKLKNPRKSNNKKGSILFDIYMDNDLPDYLQYDYDVNKK